MCSINVYLNNKGDQTQRDELMRGFWELLELGGDETLFCRIELLRLLLQSADSRTVSITHFLLGYPLQEWVVYILLYISYRI